MSSLITTTTRTRPHSLAPHNAPLSTATARPAAGARSVASACAKTAAGCASTAVGDGVAVDDDEKVYPRDVLGVAGGEGVAVPDGGGVAAAVPLGVGGVVRVGVPGGDAVRVAVAAAVSDAVPDAVAAGEPVADGSPHSYATTSALATRWHGSPPKLSLDAVTAHVCWPPHAAVTKPRTSKPSDAFASHAPAAYAGHAPAGVP